MFFYAIFAAAFMACHGELQELMDISYEKIIIRNASFIFVDLTGGNYSYNNSYIGCRTNYQDGVSVTCLGVDPEEAVNQLPNDTENLEISNSYLPILRKPFFSNLSSLNVLKLSDNSHRYVLSKAFLGLKYLQILNLSNNEIIVLKDAFKFTPNLKVVDLSLNNLVSLKTVANALSHLIYLSKLYLDHNVYIMSIKSDDMLPLSETNLTELHLSNTTIKIIEAGSFNHLKSLTYLGLSVNHVNEEGLKNVTTSLVHTCIKKLDIKQIVQLQRFPYEALAVLQNSSISLLDIGFNSFRYLPKFPPIPSLTTLRCPFCDIESFEDLAFENLPNLTYLVLYNNKITEMDKSITSLENLRKIVLFNQRMPPYAERRRSFIKKNSMKKLVDLQILNMANTYMGGSLLQYTFFTLNNLQRLDLPHTQTTDIEDFAFKTLTSLQYLNLQGNYLTFLSNNTFVGLHNLRFLFLAYNSIYFPNSVYPFQHCTQIQILYLHRNKIETIPPSMFSVFKTLEALTMFQNVIVSWNYTIFSENSTIYDVNLAKNKITHVTSEMIKDFTKVQRILDVSENPFNCNHCTLERFQNFMNTSSISFFWPSARIGTYCCLSPNNLRGISLVRLNLPLDICLDISFWIRHLSALIISCTLLFAVAMVIWMCYIYRWYLRYFLFRFNANVKKRRSSKEENTHYTYDAFVSYNAADVTWVTTQLIPELEYQEPRAKLCIHERDFEVGRLITENILDAIEVSRKVILVLSEDFVKSEWCMFELHMAQHKLFDDTRDVLILIKLKHINHKLYTKNLSYLERTRMCISWTDNSAGKRLFWAKVRRALGASLESEMVKRI